MEVPLLPKLRGQFAEFLQHRSLKRLGMLYLPTCVGLGYGLTLGLFPGTPSLPTTLHEALTAYGIRHHQQAQEY